MSERINCQGRQALDRRGFVTLAAGLGAVMLAGLEGAGRRTGSGYDGAEAGEKKQ